MKTKIFALLLCAVLFVSTYASYAQTPTAEDVAIEYAGEPVKVAVYTESNIDSNEQAKVVDAIGVVESRFEGQVGYKVDFEIVGSWDSRKDSDDPLILLQDAISKTDGVIAPIWDNYPAAGSVWRFKLDDYVAGLYIVDQDLEGDRVGGVAVLNYHAAILDYHWDSWWNQFDWLCSGIQHELSHLFGLEECNEPWCVMNYDYMPYETYLNLIIIKIKLSEQWATDWGAHCRQTLINTYEGTILKRTKTYRKFGGVSVYVLTWTWTEEYHNWNLTQLRLKEFSAVNYPLYVPQTGFLTRPSIIAGRCFIEK